MMGFVLQFATLLSICWLSQGMVTRPVQDEDRRLNNKHSNQHNPSGGDFYFDEQTTDDNVKTGKAIHQSAWLKEDEENHHLDESKTDKKVGGERGLKSILSYLRNLVQELKTEVSSIKEKASRKINEESNMSQENVNESEMQNEMEENDEEESVYSETNTENENKKQQFKSNYITNYYRKNDIKVIDEEAKDEDLENSSDSSSDESDDSSHEPEVSKGNKNSCNKSKCTEIKRKPDTYSFETKKTTAIPTSETMISKEGVKKLDYTPKDRNGGDLKESSLRYEQNHSKESDQKNAIKVNGPQSSQTKKCANKNFKNSLKKKNGPIERPSSSTEHTTTENHQSKSFEKSKSKKANQGKNYENFPKGTSLSPDYRRPRKNSKNIDDNDFDDESGMLSQSTTFETSIDATSSDNLENQKQPYVFGMSSRKPIDILQKEQITSNAENQITSPKPEIEQTSSEPEEQTTSKPEEEQQIKSPETEEEEQTQKLSQNKTKFLKNIDHTTTASQSQLSETVIQSSTSEINTDVPTSDSEANVSPKDSKRKESNVISTRTPLTYYKIHPNLNENVSKDNSHTANDLGTVNISPTNFENTGNTDNSSKASSDNLRDNSASSGNNESEKSGINNQGKTGREIQTDIETEQLKETGSNSFTSTNTISIDDSNKALSNNLKDEPGTSENDQPANSDISQLSKRNQGGSETEQQIETGNTSLTSSRNTINIDSSSIATYNLIGEPGTSENEKSANSDISQLIKNYHENQEEIKMEPSNAQQLNNDPEPKLFLKNEALEHLNPENDNKEEDYRLSLVEIDGFQSKQDSNREIQNENNETPDKLQIAQQYTGKTVERDGRYEILINPEYEYKYGKNSEGFDSFHDMLELKQDGEEKFIFNNRDVHNNDDSVSDDTATVFTNLPTSFHHAENIVKEEHPKKFDTLLEYLYSNNPSILAYRDSVK